MARILFFTMPITGHVRPALPVARELTAAGHEVLWYCGRLFEPHITRVGATFTPSSVRPKSIDADGDVLQNLEGRKPGLSGFKKIILELFIDSIPEYARDVEPIIDDFRPDVIVADHSFLAAPMLARLKGIPSVMFAISPLHLSSVDTAPFGTGMMPSATPLGHLRNRALQWVMTNVVFHNVQRALVRSSAKIGFPRCEGLFMDWGIQMVDRYLVTTIPEFEYHRGDLPAAVEFVGPMLPQSVDDWTPPSWWPELQESGRPVILITQGTASSDPADLVLPAIEALRNENALVVATTDRHDPDEVLPVDRRPANLRLERFVPFTELLPKTDLVITNGGYGGVQMSLAYGAPIVAAGLSEDKMEVNTRVKWSGAGISLNTSKPDPDKIRAAALKVLSEPSYGARARELQAAYARYSGAGRAAEVILEVVADAARVRT
jgi:MGT family glycosyltransferase